MSGVIDTNILLYAANRDAGEHLAARSFLLDASTSHQTWYLPEGCLYEFLRAATHPRVFPQPLQARDACSFIHSLIRNSAFSVLQAGPQHWQALLAELEGLTRPSGNLFFDIRTVVQMRENGISRIYTTDTDFLQFPGINVINPLR